MKTVVILMSILAFGSAAAFWLAGAMPGRIVVQDQSQKTNTDRSSTTKSTGRVIRAVGYIEPVSEIRKLSFKIDGVIEKCHVEVGQQVEAGAILSALRNQDEQADIVVVEQQLAVTKAERDKLLSGVHPKQIEAAERRIAKLEEKVRHSQQQYNRQVGLSVSKASTQEAFEFAKTDLQQAKDELQATMLDLNRLKTHVRDEDKVLAESKVRLAEANIVAAKVRLQNTILAAPISGAVLEILKREGEAVRVFDPQPIIVFGDLRRLRIRAEIDERYVASVHVGQKAMIYGRGLGDLRIAAKIVLVKTLMGGKTVFSREAAERKDLDVLQVFIETDSPLIAPIGLQVDVEINAATP